MNVKYSCTKVHAFHECKEQCKPQPPCYDENRIRPSQAEWLAIVLNGNLSLYSLTASLVMSC